MKKDSEQVPYKVTASLPYPLWLVGSPYRIVAKLGEAELSFETVRQTAYDARLLIQEGAFDFKTDRQGWAIFHRPFLIRLHGTQTDELCPVGSRVFDNGADGAIILLT